jgi:hypothetical protein
MAKLTWLVVATLTTLVLSDFYMHSPRGSNDRLNEQSADRDNGDRLFDSQNNNKGGYNVCDRTNTPFDATTPTLPTPTDIYNSEDRASQAQYPFVFLESSIVPVEWTNQHGCGGNLLDDPNKLNCNIVIQYTCQTPRTTAAPWQGTSYNGDYALNVYLMDGGNTNTPDQPNTYTDITTGATFTTNNNGNVSFVFETISLFILIIHFF